MLTVGGESKRSEITWWSFMEQIAGGNLISKMLIRVGGLGEMEGSGGVAEFEW